MGSEDRTDFGLSLPAIPLGAVRAPKGLPNLLSAGREDRHRGSICRCGLGQADASPYSLVDPDLNDREN
jgi:hypothetical protein